MSWTQSCGALWRSSSFSPLVILFMSYNSLIIRASCALVSAPSPFMKIFLKLLRSQVTALHKCTLSSFAQSPANLVFRAVLVWQLYRQEKRTCNTIGLVLLARNLKNPTWFAITFDLACWPPRCSINLQCVVLGNSHMCLTALDQAQYRPSAALPPSSQIILP